MDRNLSKMSEANQSLSSNLKVVSLKSVVPKTLILCRTEKIRKGRSSGRKRPWPMIIWFAATSIIFSNFDTGLSQKTSFGERRHAWGCRWDTSLVSWFTKIEGSRDTKPGADKLGEEACERVSPFIRFFFFSRRWRSRTSLRSYTENA